MALEILENKKGTNADLVQAGNLAGKAIQITPTTILHSLSYPLTGRYGISHGKAMSFFVFISGCYSNIVGLPIPKLASIIKNKSVRPEDG